MSLNGSQQVVEVRNHIKRTEGGYSSDRILVRLNWTQDKIADLYSFAEMITSYTGGSFTDGLKTYTFPTALHTVKSLVLISGTNSRKLIKRSRMEQDEFNPYPESKSESKSTHYINDGATFDVDPIPDATYSYLLRYYKKPTALTSGSYSDFQNKDALIVAGATVFCCLDLMEWELANTWITIFYKSLDETSRADAKKLNVDFVPILKPFGGGALISGQPEADPIVLRW